MEHLIDPFLGWGGGLSEHVVVPRAAIYEIPDSVSIKIGGEPVSSRRMLLLIRVPALAEPISVAWHSIDISPLKKGDKILVLGGGPIGLAVIQCLKARGVETIIASEVSARRKEFAKQFGAHHVIDPTQEDIVARVREICGGVGVDVAFDAAGVQAGLNQALKAVRAQGTMVNIAIWEKPVQLQMNDIVFRERKYIGTTTFVAGDFRKVLDAIASGELLKAFGL